MGKSKDLVFLTVGNKKQKSLCEKMLLSIAPRIDFDIKIVSDDDFGCRMGSGGAIFNILRKFYNKEERILVINSGGMSKRSINYALKGKAFANIIYNDEVYTLLEMIIFNAKKLLNCCDSGMIICCSDILVNFECIDLHFSSNTGVGIKTNFKTASRHGVMICDNQGKIIKYLHKASESKLKRFASECSFNNMLVDTGITFFTKDFIDILFEISIDKNIIKMLSSHSFEVNLYSDIISLLSENINITDYLKTETENEKHYKFKEILFEKISKHSMYVYEVSEQKFMHFGSTAEMLENVFYLSKKEDVFLESNSYIDDLSQIGKHTFLDNVKLTNCKIGNNCLISDIDLENISISDNKNVCGIKLTDGSFVTVICDTTENPKETIEGTALWDTPRFYRGSSFSQSFEKFCSGSKEEALSMSFCVEHADYDYCFNLQQYLNDIQDYCPNLKYIEKREEIVSSFFSKRKFIDKIECHKNKVEIFLPLRVNLSGTWTDAMPYCIENGGEVINMAVEIDGEKPVKITAEKLEKANSIEFFSDGKSHLFSFDKKTEKDNFSDFSLHEAVLKTLGITEQTDIKNGFRLSTNVKGIDKGSGLGTSSILLGGCFMVLNEMFSLNYDKSQIIKMVFVAEQLMNTGGGWQDQLGGLTSGLKIGTSFPGIKQDIDIRYIELSEKFSNLFSKKLVLLPTGQRHFGRFIVNDVANRYLNKNEESVKGHIKIKALNKKLLNSFENDDYHGFINCINEHRTLLKLISPKVTNENIEKIVEKCLEKADAVSYLGAGGGGYLLVVLNKDTNIIDFKKFVKESFLSISSQIKKIDICYDEKNL